MIGDALVLVAVGLYVTRLTGDPADVGLVLGAYSLPLVLLVCSAACWPTGCRASGVMIASDVGAGGPARRRWRCSS